MDHLKRDREATLAKEDNQNKDCSEEIFCPVLKHKIHCSQLEGTQASELPGERRYEFCITKCSIYIKGIKEILTKMGRENTMYDENLESSMDSKEGAQGGW